MKLTRIQHPQIIKETQRRYQTRKILVESREPLTGCYYWYPRPITKLTEHNNTNEQTNISNWDIICFYDPDYNNDTLHETVWPEVLRMLSVVWNKDYDKLKSGAKECYTALPRGRVTLVKKKGQDHYNILHGNNNPPDTSLNQVVSHFNLKNMRDNDALSYIYDEHQRPLKADAKRFQLVTGIKLSSVPDFVIVR